MLTVKDFENMGKQATADYIRDKTPLNDSIVKIAEERALNPAQVARVVEQANVETYVTLNKIAEDKYIEFKPADTIGISSKLNFTIKKSAALMKDTADLVDKSYNILSNDLPEDVERQKTAEAKELKTITKEAEFLLDNKLAEIDVRFTELSDDLYNKVKQASLETGSFGLVKKAMIGASSAPITGFIADAYKERLQKEAGARIDFNEDVEVKGVLNEDHPIVQDIIKISALKEEYVELKGIKKSLYTDGDPKEIKRNLCQTHKN